MQHHILLPLTACLLCASLSALAQSKPTSDTHAPAGTATVNTIQSSEGPYPSGVLLNTVTTWSPKQPMSSDATVTSSSNTNQQVSKNIMYSDGYGRPIQVVSWQASPGGADMVRPIYYTSIGSDEYQYQSYTATTSDGSFKPNAFADQNNFYTNTYPAQQPAYQHEGYFYTHIDYENSPSRRVLKTFAPGNSWAGSEGSSAEKCLQTQYSVNSSSDVVQVWNLSTATPAYSFADVGAITPVSTTTYQPGTLTKIVSINESGNQTISFSDIDGRVVLKKTQAGAVTAGNFYTNWLCTYYVYDDVGQLYFVITPSAVTQLVAAGTWTLSSTLLNEQCYSYLYDLTGHNIAEHDPGATGWRYTIYDVRDRPTFEQNPNMAATNLWRYTLYDALDRSTQTGMIQYSGTASALQSSVTSLNNASTAPAFAVSNQQLANAPFYVLSTPDNNQTSYYASEYIDLNQGFSITGTSSSVVFAIAPANAVTSTPVQAFNGNPIPGGSTPVALTMTYYDNYANASSSKSYSTAGLALDGGTNASATIIPLPSTPSTQILGTVTSVRVRVLENPSSFSTLSSGIWLEHVNYYDHYGRTIQTISDNYKGGLDYLTSMYNFAGLEVCSWTVHNNPAANVSGFIIKKNNNFDAQGRLTSITKELGNTPQTSGLDATTLRTVQTTTYDALGMVLNSKIGEQTTPSTSGGFPTPNAGTWLENENYAYNIRGWLKGINWNYPSGSGPTSPQVSATNQKWFATDISYDWGFANSSGATTQFNGNAAGIRWAAAGDGKERSYGFTYDAANRMTESDFTQNFGGSFINQDPNNSNYNIDYSVAASGHQPGISYDANGNIQSLQQFGLVNTGTSFTSPQIDNITYNNTVSGVTTNRLITATDAVTTKYTGLGDFIRNSTSTTGDFVYDANGNVVQDLNRRATFTYDYLDLPYTVTIANANGTTKGTLTYIYDALGYKLEKRVDQMASSNTPEIKTTTTYLDGFVYQNNVLQYFGQEKGRIRPQTNSSGSIVGYVYDYFLVDQLDNIRAVLSDRQQQDIYPAATLEGGPSGLTNSSAADYIEQNYYSINSANIVALTSIPNYTAITDYENKNGGASATAAPINPNPNVNPTALSQYVYQLSGTAGTGNTNQMGLGITLQVMAGDVVNIFGKSFYMQAAGSSNTYQQLPMTAIVAGLLGGPMSRMLNTAGSEISSNLITQNPENVTLFQALATQQQTEESASGSTVPRAYINYIIFDNNFNVISTGADQVGTQPGAVKDHSQDAALQNIAIPVSGYIYVYCSNESAYTNVNFDNLQVVANHGPLVEETHYYPQGLIMEGISSSSLNSGGPANLYKYQGKEMQSGEFSDNTGLQEYDFGKRLYDQQLGIWHSQDPAHQGASPYQAMSSNWPNGKDPDGSLFLVDDAIVSGIGFLVGYISSGISSHHWGWNSIEKGLIDAAEFEIGYLTGGGGLSAAADNPSLAVSSTATHFLENQALNMAVGQFFPSIPVKVGNITVTMGVSAGISPAGGVAPGASGINFGPSVGVSATFGDWTLGGSFSGRGSEIRYGGSAAYKEGGNVWSLAITDFSGQTDSRAKSNDQALWQLGFKRGDFSIRVSEDVGLKFFNGPHTDKYRTFGAQVGVGNFIVGATFYTTDHGNAQNPTDHPSLFRTMWSHTGADGQTYSGNKEGQWVEGERVASPLYIGYIDGNNVYRFGLDAPAIFDFFQNGVHGLPIVRTPQWDPCYGTPAKPYFYMGTNDPNTLY